MWYHQQRTELCGYVVNHDDINYGTENASLWNTNVSSRDAGPPIIIIIILIIIIIIIIIIIPLLTVSSPTYVTYVLFFKNVLIHSFSLPLIPRYDTLCTSMPWSTLSYAFVKLRYAASTSLLSPRDSRMKV